MTGLLKAGMCVQYLTLLVPCFATTPYLNTGGTHEHYTMVLVESPDKTGAKWTHKSTPLPDISMMEAAIGLLNDKQVHNVQCITESAA
jgi:hypothetical protein